MHSAAVAVAVAADTFVAVVAGGNKRAERAPVPYTLVAAAPVGPDTYSSPVVEAEVVLQANIKAVWGVRSSVHQHFLDNLIVAAVAAVVVAADSPQFHRKERCFGHVGGPMASDLSAAAAAAPSAVVDTSAPSRHGKPFHWGQAQYPQDSGLSLSQACHYSEA